MRCYFCKDYGETYNEMGVHCLKCKEQNSNIKKVISLFENKKMTRYYIELFTDVMIYYNAHDNITTIITEYYIDSDKQNKFEFKGEVFTPFNVDKIKNYMVFI